MQAIQERLDEECACPAGGFGKFESEVFVRKAVGLIAFEVEKEGETSMGNWN